MGLRAGKLPPDLLRALLSELPALPADVVVGPQLGEDAAVVEVDGRYLVIASDPVTLSAHPGSVAVQVNANDIAVMGAEPRWLVVTLLLPLGSTAEDARSVISSLSRAASQIGVSVIGGHTEVTPSVTQPVVAATMIGEVESERLVRSSGARPGDVLLLAGPVAVEGTAILAAEYPQELLRRGVSRDRIEEAVHLLQEPGISVLPASRALRSAVLPHAMHDPTEGGLISALREVAAASGVGAHLHLDRVPILLSCSEICAALELDPLGLLASGSLLVALAPEDVDAAVHALGTAAIEAAVIGKVLLPDEGLFASLGGRRQPLPAMERDELARWIESRQ